MTRAPSRARAVALVTLAAAGCASPPPIVSLPPRPAPTTDAAHAEWPREFAIAQAAALRLEFVAADSVLRAFSTRFPGTPQSSDAVFWRAVFRLDPAAAAGDSTRDGIRDAVAAFDAYLAGGPAQPRFAEAASLRRIAGQVDSLRAQPSPRAPVPAVPPTPASADRDSLRVRDEEITRLRQELQETRAELERIRRRLAPRRP